MSTAADQGLRDLLSNSAAPSSSSFMPHGMCYLWQTDVLALHIISDALIALAYFSIPFTLLYFVRKRRDLEFNWMFVCFAIFIVACGTSHLMEVWVIWRPDYWLSGAVKAVTALASVPTAVLLIRLLPAALSIPSPAALEREIAERRRTEQELIAANDRLRNEAARGRLAAIVEFSDDAIISKTTDGIITSWNQGAHRLFGYSASEAIGQPTTMLFAPERLDEEAGILARVGGGERIDSFETVRVRKDGHRIEISATISPIRDEMGTIVGASKIARDITQRKRAAEALAEQAKILDLAQVIVRDPDGRILRWSHGAEKLYGYSPDEALGHISHELLVTRFPEPLVNIEAQLLRTGTWEGEVSHRTRSGTQLEVASVWVLHRDAEGKPRHVLESNTDVSARRRAENKLGAQLARMHLLNTITRAIGERQDLASITQVVIRTLEDHLPIDFGCLCLHQPPDTLTVAGVGIKSLEFSTALGLSPHTRVPIDQNGLSHCLHGQLVYEPDLSQACHAFPQRLFAAGLRAMVAAPLLVKSKVFGALIVGRRIANSFSGGECEFLGQLSEHVALAAHQTQLHASLQVAYEDLRQTQQVVMRQEKLRVLGQMASGIAHDINNALSPAALYVESLLEREGAQSEARDYLVIIQRAIEGVAQTVARMKEFYSQRDTHSDRTQVSLNRVAAQVIDLTRAGWEAMSRQSGVMIRVQTDLAPDLPAVTASESEIRDALTNLILNAADAMPQGGQITVRSRTLGADRVQLEVADTGVGMDEATRTRCLELFFTTKGARGTGLGLAMVYGTVERHDGELQIESEPGAGTTVRLILPIAAPPPAADGSPHAPPSLQQPLRILVIDDDPIILQSLLTILELDGHLVAIADGGERGIAAFRSAEQRREPFELVITDLGMPEVDGRAVAAIIKSIRTRTPVILLTGWGHRLLAENDIPEHVDRVLGKPPKLSSLRAMIAELTRVAST
jgi:PAS domain S-box-containing protein